MAVPGVKCKAVPKWMDKPLPFTVDKIYNLELCEFISFSIKADNNIEYKFNYQQIIDSFTSC